MELKVNTKIYNLNINRVKINKIKLKQNTCDVKSPAEVMGTLLTPRYRQCVWLVTHIYE